MWWQPVSCDLCVNDDNLTILSTLQQLNLND